MKLCCFSVIFMLCSLPQQSLAAGNPEFGTLEACRRLTETCLFPSDDTLRAGRGKSVLRQCYETIAEHPFCAGTAAGEFASRRRALFAGQAAEERGLPGFLGTVSWNQDCIQRLDTEFIQLSQESASEFGNGMKEIQADFSDCAIDVTNVLSRP